jgi:REP element-mobilizing transposase RayT
MPAKGFSRPNHLVRSQLGLALQKGIVANSHRLRLGRRSEGGRSYLITITCYHRRNLFDRLDTVGCLARSIDAVSDESRTWCWIAMPDHMHWLFELRPNAVLSRIVGKMKALTTRKIRNDCAIRGPIWQRGFHDRAIRKDENLRSAARYVLANPLKAGLAESVNDYPYWDAVWLDRVD